MIHKKINQAKTCLCVCLLLLIISCTKKENKYKSLVDKTQKIEQLYLEYLENTINHLDSIRVNTVENKKKHYVQARKNFKLLEPILAYTDKNNYKTLNAPNITIVKEEDVNDIKVFNPIGFQVLEETLYEEKIDTIALNSILKTTLGRLKLIKQNVLLKLKDHHIIWLLRDQLVRIASTGITGFDSPVLGQSLLESSYTYETLKDILKFYEYKFSSKLFIINF